MKAVPAYIEKYSKDPTVLLTEQHMSDALSSPDEDGVETAAEWKVRMARHEGVNPEKTALERVKFLEQVKPEWRSEKVRVRMYCHGRN